MNESLLSRTSETRSVVYESESIYLSIKHEGGRYDGSIYDSTNFANYNLHIL